MGATTFWLLELEKRRRDENGRETEQRNSSGYEVKEKQEKKEKENVAQKKYKKPKKNIKSG